MSFQEYITKKQRDGLSNDEVKEITLFDLNQYFEGPIVKGELRPIVGNESIRMIATLSWIVMKMFVLLEGESGSAKSEIMNSIIALMFGDDGLDGESDQLYLLDQASDKSQTRKERVISRADYAFIPELQNAVNHFPMLKKWAEGKVFKYEITKNDEVKEFKVPPKPVLSCIAINNEILSQLPAEIIRRFLHLWTQVSIQINNDVQRRKGEIRALPDAELPIMETKKKELLREKLRLASEDNRVVKNPFAPKIQEILPKNFTVSNSYVDVFFNLIEAVTLFREAGNERKGNHILSTFMDNYIAVLISGDMFINLCLGLQDVGKEVLDAMIEPRFIAGTLMTDIPDDQLIPVNGYYTIKDLMNLQKEKLSLYRDKKTTEDTVNRLFEAGYLDIRKPRKGKENYYFKVDEIDDDGNPLKQKDFWKDIWEFGKDWVEEHYNKEYDAWLRKQTFKFNDPYTGTEQEVDI